MTLVLVLTTFLLSVAIPNVKDAIAIAGATVNPFIGFIFPILFYLKIDPAPLNSPQKLFSGLILIIIVITSPLGLYSYLKHHL